MNPLEPRERIGLSTSFLPRKRSTDELPRRCAEDRIRRAKAGDSFARTIETSRQHESSSAEDRIRTYVGLPAVRFTV